MHGRKKVGAPPRSLFMTGVSPRPPAVVEAAFVRREAQHVILEVVFKGIGKLGF